MKNILQARLTKVNETTGEFWGIAAEEGQDLKGEIFDYEASKPLIKAWSDDIYEHSGGKSYGNLRAQHNSKVAVGRLLDLTFNDAAKAVEVHGEVVDAAELEKLAKGLYTGLSFGGDYGKKWRSADGKLRYSAKPVELSLADKPAAPTTRFTLVKVDGSEQEMEFHKAAAGDYGDKKDAGYADPGLQKDKKPRYPLKINGELSEKRIRAAWNYINKQKNADKYAADDLAKVKDKITAAWKEAIDQDGPPSASEKTAAAGDLQKSMYHIGRMADLLSSLQYLSQDMDWEALQEMDGSEMPNQLKAWCEQGCEILKAMVAEETDELVENLMTKTAEAGELGKVGAAISGKNMEHIQQIHDHAAAMGAACGGESMSKLAKAGTLQKVADLEAGIKAKDEEMAKVAQERDEAQATLKEKDEALEKVAGEKAALEKEIGKLNEEPAPAKGALREGLSAPSKEEDSLENTAQVEEPKTPLEAMKVVHTKPFIMSGH
ncbi:MAG: hypothetical protein M1438_19975 [Deltaproteobacteria bacterium]|nr:hypothetical protein [Deltaproteobacteria bacterium]